MTVAQPALRSDRCRMNTAAVLPGPSRRLRTPCSDNNAWFGAASLRRRRKTQRSQDHAQKRGVVCVYLAARIGARLRSRAMVSTIAGVDFGINAQRGQTQRRFTGRCDGRHRDLPLFALKPQPTAKSKRSTSLIAQLHSNLPAVEVVSVSVGHGPRGKTKYLSCKWIVDHHIWASMTARHRASQIDNVMDEQIFPSRCRH
jgi:hypothetical protein